MTHEKLMRLADEYTSNANTEWKTEQRKSRAALSTALQEVLAERDALANALEDILGCPYHLDEATISSDGLEETMKAVPYQVVGNMSVALMRVRKARAVLAAMKGQTHD